MFGQSIPTISSTQASPLGNIMLIDRSLPSGVASPRRHLFRVLVVLVDVRRLVRFFLVSGARGRRIDRRARHLGYGGAQPAQLRIVCQQRLADLLVLLLQ